MFMQCCVRFGLFLLSLTRHQTLAEAIAGLSLKRSAEGAVEAGLRLAEEALGITRLLTAEELASPEIDEQSVMTYVSLLRRQSQVAESYSGSLLLTARPEALDVRDERGR